ncbi:MAG: HAMP domain-containing protein [Betaproteobacteria bacterium]|nr:HAMP domain-containing protein [Betaproteobacteria bacterium]
MLALAWWVAGRWSRPLRSLQQATRRMAQGELGVQVPPQGAREITGLIDDVNTLSSNLKSWNLPGACGSRKSRTSCAPRWLCCVANLNPLKMVPARRRLR